jgi:spermidine synthase
VPRAAALLAALLAMAPAGPAERVHAERSLYRNIIVEDSGSTRCMLFGHRRTNYSQSCMRRDDPLHLVFSYTRMMLSGLFVQPRPGRILIVGLGGGTLPGVLSDLFPDAAIDTVEIDAAVVRVAREYFGFRETPRQRVIEQDARVFVKRAIERGERYDHILLDAFTGDYIPEHLLTREFLEEARALLAPGGVVVANTFASSQLYHNESVTYEAVFGPFFNVRLAESANRIIVAAATPLPAPEAVATTARELAPRLARYGVDAGSLAAGLHRDRDWDTGARVLTDQYAPANLLRGQR